MSFIYDFADNVSISADDLNSIASGISENAAVSDNFADNTSYMINKLNLIRSDILNPGIAYGIQCSFENDSIILSPGVAFFTNGMRFEITEDEVFTPIKNATTYIYLYAPESFSLALPIITEEKKTSSSYIPVAEVDMYGNVTDKRTFCSSKVPLHGGSYVEKHTITKTVVASGSASSPNKSSEVIPLENPDFNYIIFDVTITIPKKTEKLFGYFRRSDMLCYGFYSGTYSEYPCNGTPHIGYYDINRGTYVMPQYENGVLTLHYDSMNGAGTMTITMEVI